MLKHAMYSVQMGYKTVNQAAKEYNIPRQTLQYRLFKHKRKHHTFSPTVIPHNTASKPGESGSISHDVIKSEVTSSPSTEDIRKTLSDTVLKGMLTSSAVSDNGTSTPGTPLSSLGLKCLSSLILSDPNLVPSSKSEAHHSPPQSALSRSEPVSQFPDIVSNSDSSTNVSIRDIFSSIAKTANRKE